MNKKALNWVLLVGGLALLGAGLTLLKLVSEPQGILLVLPYVLIGLGCGAFGHGLGDLVNRRVYKNNPALLKQMEIDQKDERNIAIANRAKAKAYDLMLYVFAALMIAFALMNVEVAAVLLLVAAYLLVVGLFVYNLSKYQKEI